MRCAFCGHHMHKAHELCGCSVYQQRLCSWYTKQNQKKKRQPRTGGLQKILVSPPHPPKKFVELQLKFDQLLAIVVLPLTFWCGHSAFVTLRLICEFLVRHRGGFVNFLMSVWIGQPDNFLNFFVRQCEVSRIKENI